MSLVTLVLTVRDPTSGRAHDIVARGSADQSVADLAGRLAIYLGRGNNEVYSLRVERTGEQLRPEAPLTGVDLLDGDVATLVKPRRLA